jgi:hypothetical protein
MTSVEAFRYFVQAGFEILDVVPEHALATETLPRLHGICSTAFYTRRPNL